MYFTVEQLYNDIIVTIYDITDIIINKFIIGLQFIKCLVSINFSHAFIYLRTLSKKQTKNSFLIVYLTCLETNLELRLTVSMNCFIWNMAQH